MLHPNRKRYQKKIEVLKKIGAYYVIRYANSYFIQDSKKQKITGRNFYNPKIGKHIIDSSSANSIKNGTRTGGPKEK